MTETPGFAYPVPARLSATTSPQTQPIGGPDKKPGHDSEYRYQAP
jgi:hypothetical protein